MAEHKRIKLVVIAVLLGAAGLFLSGDVPGFGQLSSFTGLSPSDCQWHKLQINGETFSSLTEFKQAAQRHGQSFTKFKQKYRFKVQSGVLHYKARDCSVDVQGGTAE